MTKNSRHVIEPISRTLIETELNEERFVKKTNKAGNEIYIINHYNSPNTMLEIGRLREVSFRAAGGGTGQAMDIDEADTSERCYEQLIVYSPEDREIIGGYRFITGERARNPDTDEFDLSTAHYFNFTDRMKKKFLPFSIELGRSWVQPAYQPANNPRKGVFALMNIWDGLGSLVTTYPDIKYLFGKVTMYAHYNKEARDLLLSFMNHYFPNRPDLCTPKKELYAPYDNELFNKHFKQQLSYEDGFKLLNKLLKEKGEYIPPLINIYMGLSKTMITFGTAQNPDFGDVEETGILVTISDIHQAVKDRHIDYETS
ncbi:MAG: GNAT family N-acetyltransferase [Bacteroidota bacterium]